MFSLTATVEVDLTPRGLSCVSFWDESQEYGVSFSCYIEKPGELVEVMVSDQSNYRPKSFTVQLSRTLLRLSLPPGTVRPDEGGDEFAVHFRISDDDYQDLRNALAHLLAGRAQFQCLDDSAVARPNTSLERTREG